MTKDDVATQILDFFKKASLEANKHVSESELEIIVVPPNPNVSQPLRIIIDDEITVCFDTQHWHDELENIKETQKRIEEIIKEERVVVSKYENGELKVAGSVVIDNVIKKSFQGFGSRPGRMMVRSWNGTYDNEFDL